MKAVASAQAASDYKAIVCLFLFGGNDAYNMVLPTDSASWSAYSTTRNQAPDSIALLSPGTAQRLLDLPAYLPADKRKGVISLHEVYGTVQGAVWSELKKGGDIDRMRRSLQREHLKRVQALLTKGSPYLPADALGLSGVIAAVAETAGRRETLEEGQHVGQGDPGHGDAPRVADLAHARRVPVARDGALDHAGVLRQAVPLPELVARQAAEGHPGWKRRRQPLSQ